MTICQSTGELSSQRSLDLLIFNSTGDWEDNTRRRLFTAMARQLCDSGGHILSIERPICPLSTPVKHWDKFTGWLRGPRRVRQVEDNVFLYTPLVAIHDVAAPVVPGAVTVNKHLLCSGIRSAISEAQLGSSRLVVWISHPVLYYWADLFPGALTVYECWDAHEMFASVRGNPRAQGNVVAKERYILDRADVVIATSRKLFEKQRALHGNVFFVPNGVDFDHFAGPTDGEISPPQDLLDCERPWIGFVGKLNELIDYELLEHLASHIRPGTIFLVGPFDGQPQLRRSPGFRAVCDTPNIRLVGPRPYEAVPGYVQSFDVCIIPWVVDELTVAVNPLKLHEYLAAGKPVVSTDLPEVRQFAEVVYIAGRPAEFERQIRRALQEDCPQRQAAAREVAKVNSWDARAAQVLDIMSQVLAARQAQLPAYQHEHLEVGSCVEA